MSPSEGERNVNNPAKIITTISAKMSCNMIVANHNVPFRVYDLPKCQLFGQLVHLSQLLVATA